MTKRSTRGLIVSTSRAVPCWVELMSMSNVCIYRKILHSICTVNCELWFTSAYSNTHFHQYHWVRHRASQVRTADKFHILGGCHRVPGVALPFVPMDDLNYWKYTHFLSCLHARGRGCWCGCVAHWLLTIISFSCCCGTALWYCSTDAVSSICRSDWSKTSKVLCNVSSRSACVEKVGIGSMMCCVSKVGNNRDLEFYKSKLT